MSAWVYSLIFVFSEDDRPDAEKLSHAMGHSVPGDLCYTVPLSPTGENPPTHWMCHSFCIPEFAAMLEGIGQGTLPEPEAGGIWEDYGLTEARVWELMAAAIVSCIDGADPQTHVADVLADAGLQRIN